MKSPADMKIIQIELTNACPKRCSNCTRFLAHVKKPFFMELDFFKKAIDSLDGFEGMVGFMGGEPTLHPDFEAMVEYAVEKRQKHFKPSRQFREPIEDYGLHYARNLQHIQYPLGLWSMCGPTYYKHYELIHEHFQYQCLNDHLNEGLHQTLLTTRKEQGISDEEWYPLRDACWVQNTWSASITPKGAFFCEIAAALDMVYDGPGGWPIEPGWWKRLPSQFGSQLNWCEQCGAALKAPRRKGKEEIEDMSPHHHDKLIQLGSPAIRKGKFEILDVEKYKPENYVPDPDWYIPSDEKLSRYKQDNPSLKPKRIDVIIPCVGLSLSLSQTIEHNLLQVDSITVVTDENDLATQAVVQKQQQRMDDASKLRLVMSSSKNMLQTGFDTVKPKDWVLFLSPTSYLPKSYYKIKDLIMNPGCLYYARHFQIESYEPRPEGRGMIWEEFQTPPRFGCEIPGPEGPGFWRPDEGSILDAAVLPFDESQTTVKPKCCLFNVMARSLRSREVFNDQNFFDIWPEDKRVLLHDKWSVKDLLRGVLPIG